MLEGFVENISQDLMTLCPKVAKWVRGKPTEYVGGFIYAPVTYLYKGDIITMQPSFKARGLNKHLKLLGAKWCPGKDGDKFNFACWWLPSTQHNEWQLRYHIRKYTDPYIVYDSTINFVTEYPLRDYQHDMAADIVSHRGTIEAAEMGTGKTLAWIAATTQLVKQGQLNPTEDDIWYVGPVAGVKAVTRELRKWDANFKPKMMTYNGLVTTIKEWGDDISPRMVCFDESSCLKNPTTQRSIAAQHLSDNMRTEHENDCRIIELSGTPSPKAPIDWWSQLEIAEPGFIIEGTLAKFKARLCLLEKCEGAYGTFPRIITWFDDENKCAKCGQLRDADCHSVDQNLGFADCTFEASINEVHNIFNRAKGLVRVTLKEDCLDLPPKQYIEELIRPTADMLRVARTIRETSERAVTALCLLRELSDGFQYTEEIIGYEVCPECLGECETEQAVAVNEIDSAAPQTDFEYTYEMQKCPRCGGKGEVPKYRRATDVVDSPKDAILEEDLEQNEDIGRMIIWAGFTGTLDRLVDFVRSKGWSVLKIDGRGLVGMDDFGNPLDVDELLDAMDASHPNKEVLRRKYGKLVVVAHPKAAGMAYTFTMARMAVYYSNVFDGEARMQSEDRIHRLGMDTNAGCIIKDYILLPTDRLVLENLKQKKKLQNLTLNRLEDAFVDGERGM